MTIYYDGYCKLCSGFIRLIIKYSKPGTFIYTPLQNAAFQIPIGFSETVVVETKDGKLYAYSDAVSIILSNMSTPFRMMNALLKLFPRSIRNKVYVMIAKNRYSWFGKYDQCQIIH
jgi:predicted DCC family thiol-disulfide oxidoreductase YuxK